MSIYHWLLISGFLILFISAIIIFIDTLVLKRRQEYSKSSGKINPAIVYSFTGGMSPAKKESAYLHLPSYFAGMVFHTGTFLSFLILIMIFASFKPVGIIITGSVIVISAGIICGLSLFMKRILNEGIRKFSNPDDYFSNLLVTGFQALTLLTILDISPMPILFIWATFLFLYIPVGKLRHTIWFFTSRINLGKYFGRRNVWPTGKN